MLQVGLINLTLYAHQPVGDVLQLELNLFKRLNDQLIDNEKQKQKRAAR